MKFDSQIQIVTFFYDDSRELNAMANDIIRYCNETTVTFKIINFIDKKQFKEFVFVSLSILLFRDVKSLSKLFESSRRVLSFRKFHVLATCWTILRNLMILR